MAGQFRWQRTDTGWRARYVLRSAEGESEVYGVQRSNGELAYRGPDLTHREFYGWAYRAAGEDQRTVETQIIEAGANWYRGYNQRATERAAEDRRHRGQPVVMQDRPRVYHHAKEAMKACETVIIARRLQQAELPVLPLCLVCRHLVWSNARPGYSDMTPGDDLYIACGKGYWNFDSYMTEPVEWARMIQSAESCNDFDPTQQIRRGAAVVPADVVVDGPARPRAYVLDE
jgi:hypothetical protein